MSFNLPMIYGDVAHKSMMSAYDTAPHYWKKIAVSSEVKDFRPHTRLRMMDSFRFVKMSPNGGFEFGEVGEMKNTIQTETWGRSGAITRTDIINDDMGVMHDYMHWLGRGAANAINLAVIETLLDGLVDGKETFFSKENENLLTGADVNLGIEAFRKAELLFAERKAPGVAGDPSDGFMTLRPELLVVPASLKYDAREFMESPKLNRTKDMVSENNQFANAYEVVCIPELGLLKHKNASRTAWYLFTRPLSGLSALEVCFLLGKRTPTIESSLNDDFDNIGGIRFRGYWDFGVALMDHRCALKSKGV